MGSVRCNVRSMAARSGDPVAASLIAAQHGGFVSHANHVTVLLAMSTWTSRRRRPGDPLREQVGTTSAGDGGDTGRTGMLRSLGAEVDAGHLNESRRVVVGVRFGWSRWLQPGPGGIWMRLGGRGVELVAPGRLRFEEQLPGSRNHTRRRT